MAVQYSSCYVCQAVITRSEDLTGRLCDDGGHALSSMIVLCHLGRGGVFYVL